MAKKLSPSQKAAVTRKLNAERQAKLDKSRARSAAAKKGAATLKVRRDYERKEREAIREADERKDRRKVEDKRYPKRFIRLISPVFSTGKKKRKSAERQGKYSLRRSF